MTAEVFSFCVEREKRRMSPVKNHRIEIDFNDAGEYEAFVTEGPADETILDILKTIMKDVSNH